MPSSDKNKSGSKTKPVATNAQLASDTLLSSLLAPSSSSSSIAITTSSSSSIAIPTEEDDDDLVSSYQPPVAPARSRSKSKPMNEPVGIELSRSKDKRIDNSIPDAKGSNPAPAQKSAPKSSSSPDFSSLSSSSYQTNSKKKDLNSKQSSLLSDDSESERKGNNRNFNPIVPYERPKPPSSSGFCNCLTSINLFGRRPTRPATVVHPAERLASFMSQPVSTEEGSYVPPTGDHIPGFSRKN